MRIAYLTDINMAIESGVQKKMRAQLKSWKATGHEARIFSIPSEMSPGVSLADDEETSYFDHAASRTKFKGLNVYLRKMFTVKAVIKALKTYDPDVVYVREMRWYPGITRILSQFRIVWESNTLLLEELKAIAHPLVYLSNKLMLPAMYRQIDGLVGVTSEITHSFNYYRIPQTAVIANGIRMKDSLQKLPGTNNDRPKVMFVGSPGMKWHGVHHFYEMAELTPQADFLLVGPVLEDKAPLPNLTQFSYLKSDRLNALYKDIDVAVGSLALYVNNMAEACPLKSREYFLHGLPMIIGYKDTDLSGTEFVLELENNENGVKNGIASIHRFIEGWKGKRIDIAKYYHMVDADIKERKRLELFERVLIS